MLVPYKLPGFIVVLGVLDLIDSHSAIDAIPLAILDVIWGF